MDYNWLPTKKRWLILPVALLVLGASSVVVWHLIRSESAQQSNQEKPSLVHTETLQRLADTNTEIDRSHLAEDLLPPTNAWFSGFALQAEPKAGYSYPNSFKPSTSGFEFSLPKVTAGSEAITGPHAPDIVVVLEGAKSYKITDYDELVVELTYYGHDESALATVNIASGLPYVYLRVEQDTTVRVSGTATNHESWTHLASNDHHYGVNAATQDGTFSLPADSQATFFSAPSEDELETVRAQADTVVMSAEVTYQRRGTDALQTTFTYYTTNNQPVLFGRLPHQQTTQSSEVTYPSILGDITTEVGSSFSFETPAVPVTDKLDLSDISEKERALLVKQLQKDLTRFESKPDTYFGGKQLYRMAQLLMLAHELEENELAATAKNTLKQELDLWLTPGKNEPKSFLYDATMHGIVGNEASFGSDKEFNDHHFHYGYFIYAAAILAQHDKEFLDTHKHTVNVLVADIANYATDEALPLRRSFDPYAGHSWASGTVPFTDGNNQESTSEAINAWVGVSLWASQIDNSALKLQADWMLSQEYATTMRYWLLQNDTAPDYLASYDSPLVSIVWGGKREYSTFFSDEANAKLAIQLLPLSPTIKQLDRSLPASLFKETVVTQPYGDYILMARPDATLETARSLPDSSIDDGNSRAYLYAYIISH